MAGCLRSVCYCLRWGLPVQRELLFQSSTLGLGDHHSPGLPIPQFLEWNTLTNRWGQMDPVSLATALQTALTSCVLCL